MLRLLSISTIAFAAAQPNCKDLQYLVNGVMTPWHERNGVGNTCAIMKLHNYCTSDYFNTYNNVKVTSSEACCGCGGGKTITDGHAYTVENLVSGNFTIQTASLSPIDSGSDWEPTDTGNYLFYFFSINFS